MKRRKATHNTLSEALCRFCSEERVVNLKDKKIFLIDEVPEKFVHIEGLYLTNNQLQTLKGIAQFKNLKSLSVANNFISSVDELEYLRSLPLVHLNLEKNPLTSHPSYKNSVISILPNLKTLDNKELSATEKNSAGVSLKKQSNFTKIILDNEKQASKLENLENKLKLHSELVRNGKIKVYRELSIDKYLELVKLEWPVSFSNLVLSHLENRIQEVLSGFPEDSKDWEFAYMECLSVQQQHIADKTVVCEKLAKSCISNFTKLNDTMPLKAPRPISKPSLQSTKSQSAKSTPMKAVKFPVKKLEFEKPEGQELRFHEVVAENNKLKEQLLKFKMQNLENVDIAKKEMKKMHSELENYKKLFQQKTKAAENTQELQNELKELKNYKSKYDILVKENFGTSQKLKELQTQNTQLKEELKELSELKVKFSELSQKYTRLESENAELKSKPQNLEFEYQEVTSKLKRAEHRIKELETMLESKPSEDTLSEELLQRMKTLEAKLKKKLFNSS